MTVPDRLPDIEEPLEASMPSGAAPADEVEEEFYQQHREEMLSYMRSGGISSLQQREGGARVGLLNQGATCYMNSLLQALFFTMEFRLLLYRFRHEPEKHSTEARCIPLQLQKLFANLEMTRASAISTRKLSEACGFSGRETLEQHDLEEFCRVLFTALEESSKPLAEGIESLFSCVVTNVIRTKEEHEGKHFESKRSEKSFDIQVPVKGFSTLQEALGSLVIEEQMDGDNQWFCEDLGSKTDAVRFSVFDKLPQILCVHLNRFCFDPATWERRKISDVIRIPEVFDASFLLSAAAKQTLGKEGWHYRLKAVCLHGGTAHGGHYHAFVFDGTTWYDANDSTVSPLDECRRGNLFQKSDIEGEPNQLHSTDAYFLFFQRCDSQGQLHEVSCSAQVELPTAILEEVEMENKKLAELQRAYRYHRDLASILVYPPTASLSALRGYASSWLRDLCGPYDVPTVGYLTVQVSRSGGLQTALRKLRASMEREVEMASVDGKESPWPELLKAPQDGLNLFKYDALLGEVGSPIVPTGSTGGITLEDLFGTDRFASGSVPVLVNLKSNPTPVANDPSAVGTDALSIVVCKWDPVKKLPNLEGDCCKLIHVRPQTAAVPDVKPGQEAEKEEVKEVAPPPPQEPPDEAPSEEIFDLFASEPNAVPDVNQSCGALVADLRRLAAEALRLDLNRVALVPLTGSSEGTKLLEDSLTLREEGVRSRDLVCVEERPAPPAATANVDADAVQRPGEQGEKVADGAGEKTAPSNCSNSVSKPELGILELINRIRNTTHLYYNHPDRPQYTEEFPPVAVSKDCTLAELKGLIAKQLGLDAATLHLKRYETAPQLKAEHRTLRELGLSDSSSIFVAPGAPCAPGEHLLKITLYNKDPPPKRMSKLPEAGAPQDSGDGAEETSQAAAPPPRPKMCLHVPGQAWAPVRTLRQKLEAPVVAWANETLAAGHSLPFDVENLTWKRLRLRDGMAGKGFAILRDERKLEPSLLGLADGREVAVQVLDQDEELTPNDLIVQVRPWRVKEAKLHAPTEVKVDRSKTLGYLLDMLTERFKGILEVREEGDEAGEEDSLEVLTLPTTGGPPITIARCEKLRWGDSRLKAPTPEARETPLAELREVRDGATMVVRSRLAAAAASGAKDAPPPIATPKAGGPGLRSEIEAKSKAFAGKAGGRFGVAVPKGPFGRGGRAERGLVIRVEKPEHEAEAAEKVPEESTKQDDDGGTQPAPAETN